MNQILYTEPKNKKGGALGIKPILIIFSICLIVFAAFFIGKAVFSIINKDEEISVSDPLIDVSKVENENTLKISIKHDKIVDKIIYNWNNQTDITLQGMGRMEIDETIGLPTGTNVLNLRVIDSTGKVTTYSQEYILEGRDTTNPEIELLDPSKTGENSIKIVAKDETEIAKIEYYWNDEEPTIKEATQEGQKLIDEKVDLIVGNNKLNVIATDKAGNTTTSSLETAIGNRPRIEVKPDTANKQLIIKVTVDKVTEQDEIQKIEIIIDGNLYSTDPDGTGATLGTNEIEFAQAIPSGTKEVIIRAYNTLAYDTEDKLMAETKVPDNDLNQVNQ